MNVTDLRGRRFGLLVVQRRVANLGRYAGWECLCDCGVTVTVRTDRLQQGRRQSCDGLKKHMTPRPSVEREHPLTYKSWMKMRDRCAGREDKTRRNYKDRGITVCDRWNDFAAFLADVGERPGPEFSIERVDNDRGYEPGNCKWATDGEQRRNQRRTVRVEYEGRQVVLADLCRELGLAYSVVAGRLKNGWPLADAINKPVRPKCTKALASA